MEIRFDGDLFKFSIANPFCMFYRHTRVLLIDEEKFRESPERFLNLPNNFNFTEEEKLIFERFLFENI